jgi:chromosome segregation ATPase
MSSKTKVMTLDKLKEQNKDVILSKDEYDAVVQQIETLNEDLEHLAETNDANETRLIFYKQEIENLVAKCRAYKNKIKNQEDLQNANSEITEQMKANKLKLLNTLKNKSKSKYNKKTKEELQAEIEKEFNIFKNTYKDDI